MVVEGQERRWVRPEQAKSEVKGKSWAIAAGMRWGAWGARVKGDRQDEEGEGSVSNETRGVAGGKGETSEKRAEKARGSARG